MTSCQVVLTEASYHRRLESSALERVTCCVLLTTSNSRISIEHRGSNTCKLWTQFSVQYSSLQILEDVFFLFIFTYITAICNTGNNVLKWQNKICNLKSTS